MTDINRILKSIFSDSILVNGVAVPVAHIRYKGKSETYVTWKVALENPELIADDIDLYATATIEVDVFSKGNYLLVINAVDALLLDNDVVWIDTSSEMYEPDTELYHRRLTYEMLYEVIRDV